MNVIHFKSSKERLKYIKGEFEEIKPVVAKKKSSKKETKKGKEDGKVQAK